MRRIGVLTRDFSLYHDLVHALRERRLGFQSLAFGETPDTNVGVILTSWRDTLEGGFPTDVPVVSVPIDAKGLEDVEAAVTRALQVLEGVLGYHEVIVGIDPGQRPGVAVLADGRLVHATQVFVVHDVAALVRSLLGQFPHEAAVVRVGHGAPQDRDLILGSLWPLRDESVRLEVVDETGSTPETGKVDVPPDVAAAIHIARTVGRPLRRPPRPRPAAP